MKMTLQLHLPESDWDKVVDSLQANRYDAMAKALDEAVAKPSAELLQALMPKREVEPTAAKN